MIIFFVLHQLESYKSSLYTELCIILLMMLQGNTKVELYIFYVYILKSELLSYEFRDQT